MITVRLYGLLRLDSGIRETRVEAVSVKAVFDHLVFLGLPRRELEGCAILVNGQTAGKRTKLVPGDVVQLLPPVAGG